MTDYILRLIDAYVIASPERRPVKRQELETLLNDPRTMLTALDRLTASHPEREAIHEATNSIRAAIKRHWP